MAIEIGDLPIENGGSVHSFLYVYQRVPAFVLGSLIGCMDRWMGFLDLAFGCSNFGIFTERHTLW
jgi:hypothetical protein